MMCKNLAILIFFTLEIIYKRNFDALYYFPVYNLYIMR